MPFSRNVLWIINVTGDEYSLNNQGLSQLVMITKQEKNTCHQYHRKWMEKKVENASCIYTLENMV